MILTIFGVLLLLVALINLVALGMMVYALAAKGNDELRMIASRDESKKLSPDSPFIVHHSALEVSDGTSPDL